VNEGENKKPVASVGNAPNLTRALIAGSSGSEIRNTEQGTRSNGGYAETGTGRNCIHNRLVDKLALIGGNG